MNASWADLSGTDQNPKANKGPASLRYLQRHGAFSGLILEGTGQVSAGFNAEDGFAAGYFANNTLRMSGVATDETMISKITAVK